MMIRSRTAVAILTLFLALLVFSSKAQAVYIQAIATGGPSLGENTYDVTDGWAGDYTAEATDYSVAPSLDEGYAKSSLTGTGVELKSRSYAPDAYANSTARIQDRFTLTTMSGTAGQVLDAVLNFELTGYIEVSNTEDSTGNLSVNLNARHENQPYLDSKVIRYDVLWDDASNQHVGLNDNEDGENLFQVNPTVDGLTYSFDIPLSLDLTGMSADDPVLLYIQLFTKGQLATVDFSNTLKTDQDVPFVLTSSPPGSSYMLDTDSDYIVDGVGLFGSLDGEEVGGAVPVPGTFLLLLSGIIGIAGIRRRFQR